MLSRRPFKDPVRVVAIDAHNRVLIASGGVHGFGQLKIFDPLRFDPAAIAANPTDLDIKYAAFRGSALLSNRLDADTVSPLLEGAPRKIPVRALRFEYDTAAIGLSDLARQFVTFLETRTGQTVLYEYDTAERITGSLAHRGEPPADPATLDGERFRYDTADNRVQHSTKALALEENADPTRRRRVVDALVVHSEACLGGLDRCIRVKLGEIVLCLPTGAEIRPDPSLRNMTAEGFRPPSGEN